MFDNNVAATELILRIILNKNIKVISVTGQNEMKNHDIEGRNITLDVHALDENGNEIDIEVQGNATGAHVKRARFHSSMIDSKMLKSGQKFSEMKDSHVIFIYKRDKFKMCIRDRRVTISHTGIRERWFGSQTQPMSRF